MDIYERSVRVDAPFEDVWAFHSTVDGLEALTPDWTHLRIDAVRGPDGESDPEELVAGSTIRASVQPLGVGPRQKFVSAIVARDRDDGAGYFRDVMREGPFTEWEHTHLFYADGESTLLRDRIRYELPFGSLGRAVGPLARIGFEPMFLYRHRTTKALLEESSGSSS
jgi:ligand-binding SRPBCC domain-containing protein